MLRPTLALAALLALAGCAAEAAQEPADADPLTLSPFAAVPGADVLRAQLARPESAKPRSYSARSDSWSGYAANLVAYDPASRTSTWLFDDNGQWIVGQSDLQADSSRTIALEVDVVREDTNDDDRVDADDRRAVVIAAPDGSGATTVVEAMDRDLGRFQTGPTTRLLMYQIGGAVRAVEVDLETREATAVPIGGHPGGELPS